jgi:hypothetical protein
MQDSFASPAIPGKRLHLPLVRKTLAFVCSPISIFVLPYGSMASKTVGTEARIACLDHPRGFAGLGQFSLQFRVRRATTIIMCPNIGPGSTRRSNRSTAPRRRRVSSMCR